MAETKMLTIRKGPTLTAQEPIDGLQRLPRDTPIYGRAGFDWGLSQLKQDGDGKTVLVVRRVPVEDRRTSKRRDTDGQEGA